KIMRNNTAKLRISKIELVGPNQIMNRLILEDSHFFGAFKYSSSTLSQGIDIQEMSYSKFKNKSYMGSVGKNGRKILAINTENMFPKLELIVALIYFIIYPNTFRPIIIPFSRIIKSFSNRITSAESLAISTALSTEIPTSAALIAGESLIPSPKKPTP